MRTAVATSHLRVTPGKSVVLDVDVTNTSDIIDGVTATIQGLDPAWVSLVVPVVSLFPDASATLSLRINLPTNCLAGEYLVSVQVVSIIDPERFSDHEFWLSVDPLLAASLTLHPSVVVGGSHGAFMASITNEGNVTADLVVGCRDESRHLNCVAYPATVSVPAGETHTVEIHADGKRPLFGDLVSRTITIEIAGGSDVATTAGGDPQQISLPAVATFNQKPRIPRGVLTILILAAIIALWATVFLLVVTALRDKPDATKAVATDFDAGGPGEVNLAAVAVSMSGAVSAQSTGAPLPLITVEAFRIKPSGDQVSVGSAGTDDAGAFALDSLLPGHYKLRFSAEGFDELWYPAAADAASAEEIVIAPADKRGKLDVVMAGKPGGMSGQIIAPENQGSAAAITLTITQKIENPIEGQPLPEPVRVPVDAAGNFTLAAMVTPASYTIRIEATGFDPREFDESLNAGENKVINTVTLGAAAGGFTGVVTSTNGVGLGNVDVTVSSGDFVKTTKTPTSGNVGGFSIDALETPRTYTLTFSLDGYSEQTIAVDLGSGETRSISVILVGGQGAVSGRVTDGAGIALGGVVVDVGCGTYTASTATLTASAAAEQAGTYTVSEIPAPAACTITFSSPGYISQTIRTDLTGAGVVGGLDAVLPKSLGSANGIVSTGSTGVSDVIVELSNGSNPRSTVTATSPAGAYRFADVEPGDYTLTFRKAGLATRVVIITVAADQTVERDVTLSASS
ncbi:MAG: carboxypeptidase-like regulatory domain-containing protein [Ilumatobacteraceae bacterium]